MFEGKGDNETSSSIVNLELKEWSRLNASLKQHGLQCISLFTPSLLKQPQEHLMLLDADNSCNLRTTIEMLMKDADRRQELVQDMISTNFHLREDLNAQSKANKDLQLKLEIMFKKKESTEGDGKKELQRRLKDVMVELEEVRREVKVKEEQVDVLNKKLNCFIHEEQARRLKGEEVLQKLLKKPAKDRLDNNIISLISMYEGELMELKRNGQPFQLPFSTPQPTIHFKSLIKSLERKVADEWKKNKELKEKCQELENELKLRNEELKNKKVEKIYIRDTHSKASKRVVSPSGTTASIPSRPPSTLSLQPRSTRLVHLRALPADLCHLYLEKVCSKLGVCDLEDIVTAIDKLSRHSSTFSQLEMFIRDMHLIITRYNLPRPPNKDCPCNQGLTCSDKHCMLETLDFWVKQMKHLKELQQSLTNLSEKLYPWRPIKLDPKTCSTLDLVDMVDGMVAEGCGNGACKHSEVETSEKEQLVKVIKHFQQLFNVSQLSGVYAKMSYLYRRVNEDRNFITNVKAALKLEKFSSPLEVLEAVSRLRGTESSNSLVCRSDEDVERLKTSLRTQEDFCSAFHNTMQRLISLLGVETVGQVVPTVRLLCHKLNQLTPQSHSNDNLSVNSSTSLHLSNLPDQPLYHSPQTSNALPPSPHHSLPCQSRLRVGAEVGRDGSSGDEVLSEGE